MLKKPEGQVETRQSRLVSSPAKSLLIPFAGSIGSIGSIGGLDAFLPRGDGEVPVEGHDLLHLRGVLALLKSKTRLPRMFFLRLAWKAQVRLAQLCILEEQGNQQDDQ